MVPTATETFSTSDFLALATEELQTYVMALLMSCDEEYGVQDYDVSIVSGTAAYTVPPRASGERLRNVLILVNDEYLPLPRLEPERVHMQGTTGSVEAFYVEDNEIVLVPTPGASGTLRLKYYRQPSKLVATSDCAVVSSINGARTVVTTTGTIPATFTSGVSLDAVDNNPGFRCLTIDAATTGTVSGTTITFSSALPSSVTAGDYICLAGESPIPQVPVVLHPLLAQRTALRATEAMGLLSKVPAMESTCERMRKEAITLLTPKVKGAARYLINYNGPGFGRR